MAQPNPEQFAKAVLWQLAGIRAELASARAQLDMVQDKMGMIPSPEFVQEAIDRDKATQLELYTEACTDIGLSPKPPGE